ncbi:hypothetical protein V8C26DRAFT_386734 [Trichoderma gracile]
MRLNAPNATKRFWMFLLFLSQGQRAGAGRAVVSKLYCARRRKRRSSRRVPGFCPVSRADCLLTLAVKLADTGPTLHATAGVGGLVLNHQSRAGVPIPGFRRSLSGSDRYRICARRRQQHGAGQRRRQRQRL